MTQVLVIGDVLVDEMREPTGSIEFAGDSALNVAVGLRRLGVDATLAGVLSTDRGGQLIRRHLDEAGVGILASPAPLGSPRAISDRTEGEPVYTFNLAARCRRIEVGDSLRRALRSADLVAVSGYPFDGVEVLDTLLHAVGDKPLVIDANPREGLLMDRERFAFGFLKAGATAQLIKIGADDARLLYGASVDDVARRFLDAGARRVLITEGAAGARVVDRRSEVVAPIAVAPGDVVDTMGAGDATFSSIISAMTAREPNWRVALERAMAIAAATIRAPGGMLQVPEAAHEPVPLA